MTNQPYWFVLLLALGTVPVAANEPPIVRVTRSAGSKFFLRYTPDGAHLVYSSQHANRRAANQILVGARIVKSDGSDDRQLLTPYNALVQIQEHPTVSPDGTRLLISGGGNDTGNSSKDVFIADLDKSYQARNLRKVIPGDGVSLGEEPVWSPDGRQIAFVSIDERIFVSDADGKNKTTVAQLSGNYCHQPEWSSDGLWIAFASDREGNIELFKVRRDGTELTRLTDHPGIDCRPRWSRDGQWILFSSNRASNFDLYVMRSDGTDLRPLTTHLSPDDHADWSPDGKSISFVSMRDGAFDIYRLDVPADLRIRERLNPNPPVSASVSNDLALHYSFDRETEAAKQVVDLAGRNHGELVGAKIVRDGPQGRLSFDGTKAHAICGNGEALRISGALTISVWVRPAAFTGNHYLISKQGWNIYLSSNGTPQFETRTAQDSAWDTLSATTPLKVNEWSQVVAVFDPEAQKLLLYVNGKPAGERPRNDGGLGAATGYPLTLGTYNLTQSQYYSGQMDELKILRNAMSAPNVSHEYARQRPLIEGAAIK